MTAISAFQTANAVHIFSDGAWHDLESGTLSGIGTKVHTIPQHNAVFAVTGMSTLPQLLSALLMENDFADFHSLAEAVPDLVRTCCTRAKTVGLSMTGRCDVILGGWSDKAGPSIHLTQCFFDHDIFKGSAVRRYVRPSIDDSSQMQFPADGLQLLEKQYAAKCHRAAEGTFGGATVGGLVGGFAQHTQVDADGIRIKVLKRWPDRIRCQ
ncbi:hypothetical protein GGD66_000829 [Bradyrhizobium sp. CIR48]|uniref:hypothetical protein n=1 Tax=Bradyrhizobium sp. CIR48 TaxID=2663840 RepID=UPI001605B37F|nr:hypothetical protein [Bradyrhizobium sp. CIR48]MBB4422303.1 hypothetical protein [Bradyrhizobium sp. CIR48]